MARRKHQSRRSDCVRTAEFLENLKKTSFLEDPVIGIKDLSRELNISASTMKPALNEDLRCYSYKRRRGQLLAQKARLNRLKKEKKLRKILLKHRQSGSFTMRKTFAKTKSTTLRIIDGLHTVQRTLLVSCRLNFQKM